MPPFLPLSVLLPTPVLTLAPLPPLPLPAPPRAARRHPAPLASSSKPTPRRPYRRRPAPAPAPPQRPQDAAPRDSFRARSAEELEAAIYGFMRRSDKPGAFPTRAEFLAAGRDDLAAAVDSSGGWLSLGWSSGPDAGAAVTAPASSGGGGVHLDYPQEAGGSDLAPAAGASGRETGFGTGLEELLTRLQRERERARPLPRSSNRAGGQGDNGVHWRGAASGGQGGAAVGAAR